MLGLQLPFVTDLSFFMNADQLKCIISSYRVIVGAPKSNVSARTGGGNLVRYGAAFRCQYPGNTCQQILIDNTRKCRTLLVFVQYLICMYL